MLPATASPSDATYLTHLTVPINLNMQTTWQSFEQLLTNCLDTFSVRQAILIVEECIKLESYINSEFQLNDKELYFNTQKQIIEHLNQSLKKKLFSLSRSTELFGNHKRDLVTLLEGKLTPKNLSDVLGQFEYLESQYFKLVETIKSRLKFKMAKLEKNLQVWQEFDKLCRKLNQLFEQTTKTSQMEITTEYQGLVLEISNCLNQIKEHHSLLSATCTENKYFEMKNLIVLYECKFGRFKKEFEASKQQEFHMRYFSKTVESEENFYLENRRKQNEHSNSRSSEVNDQMIPVRMVQNQPDTFNNTNENKTVLRNRNKSRMNHVYSKNNSNNNSNGTSSSDDFRLVPELNGELVSRDLGFQRVPALSKSPITKRKGIFLLTFCKKLAKALNATPVDT
jgi:hypothetical protein